MRSAKGHSLVEMLMVLGIMAVVMGLVLSVFIQLLHIVRAWHH